jgi:hypothetical protein
MAPLSQEKHPDAGERQQDEEKNRPLEEESDERNENLEYRRYDVPSGQEQPPHEDDGKNQDADGRAHIAPSVTARSALGDEAVSLPLSPRGASFATKQSHSIGLQQEIVPQMAHAGCATSAKTLPRNDTTRTPSQDSRHAARSCKVMQSPGLALLRLAMTRIGAPGFPKSETTSTASLMSSSQV